MGGNRNLIEIKEKISEEIRYDSEFTGVGVSSNKVIVFTRGNISDYSSLSTFKNDIVFTKAEFKSHALNSLLQSKFRPVIAGISVGSINGLTGTIGFIYDDLLFSASHVLSSNPVGYNGYDYVIQPGAADGGTSSDIIGKTEYYEILNDGVYGDIAFARLSTKHKNIIYGIGLTKSFVRPGVGMKVVKVGRTTGMTMGLIYTTHTDAKVFYPELNKEVFLKNQFVVYSRRFAQSGDSGSSVVFSNKIAGLVVAGDEHSTLCTPSTFIVDKIRKYKKTKEISETREVIR